MITNQKSTLLRQIQAYCREANIAESTFGFLAVNDGKLCNRLRSGKDVTLATAQKIEAFIQDHESEFPGDPVPGGPCYDNQVLSDDIPRSNGAAPVDSGRPFRFYDNRQKYLAFINTCNEKWKIAERAAAELAHVQPRPPAFRLFDAGGHARLPVIDEKDPEKIIAWASQLRALRYFNKALIDVSVEEHR